MSDCNTYLWRTNYSLCEQIVLIQAFDFFQGFNFHLDQWFSNIFSYGTQYIKKTLAEATLAKIKRGGYSGHLSKKLRGYVL